MHSTRDRTLTEIGDRARVQTDREAAERPRKGRERLQLWTMDMPPPDSYAWSVVASRHRSRTLQSSSMMDPGEGCSRWDETPPRKRLAAKATMGETEKLFQKGEKEKKSVPSSSQSQGYDPNNPGYTSQSASGSDTGGSYTPETERVSSPPPPPRHTLDLTSLVQSALEGIGATNSRSCEEDLLFDEAVRTLAPPGTEDDVVMDESGSGQLDDLEAARRYLDEDDAL